MASTTTEGEASQTVAGAEPASSEVAVPDEIQDVKRTTCCIVGGGPGGGVLALLLARKGVAVTLLEAHPDFEREFRGDTIHPSVMELMDELGLAERLLELRHTEIRSVTIQTAAGPLTPADFSRLNTRFPYITMMPQTSFLEFITEEAKRYPNFRLVMRAHVRELVEEESVIRGVRYKGHDGTHEVRALLTVGADGRGSRIRRRAGFEPIKTSPPMDVLWFRLPRKEGDPEGAIGRFGRGHIAILLDRFDYWQAGYVISKGTYPELRAVGIEAFRRSFGELIPEFAARLEHLEDWRQPSLLSAESSRCPRWYRPGLLLIGDAAHVMSPVGGVGINYAIQDAVVAANLLREPLKTGRLSLRDLRAVQRRREWPTRIIQMFQSLMQRRVLSQALDPNAPANIPVALRIFFKIPVLRDLPARLIGLGIVPVHVRQ